MRGMILMPDVPWPTHGGREIYSHHLLAALTRAGHEVHAVFTGPANRTTDGWPLLGRVPTHRLDDVATAPLADGDDHTPTAGRLNRRWQRYWGWSDAQLDAARALADHIAPDFVAAAGLNMLPALDAVPTGVRRIWLALDEPATFQRSVARSAGDVKSKLKRWRLAATFMAYQRCYADRIDAAVAVSPRDTEALRRVGGFQTVLHLPNGVDAEYFRPTGVTPEANTAVFWGRLDFEPNIQSLRWFAAHVWPRVVEAEPDARFQILGRDPSPELAAELAPMPGVQWVGPVDDVRPWANGAAVVVLPIQSGTGIKNKLLEAAAMARPVLGSPLAVDGLEADGAWRLADTPDQWVEALLAMWDEPEAAAAMGDTARQWVVRNHAWSANASALVDFVAESASPGRVADRARRLAPLSTPSTERRAA